MDLDLARRFLLWCTVINYVLLMYWFVVFGLAHDRFERILGRWFKVSGERFDAYNAMGMTIYKLGIMLFFLVPFIVLTIIT